jgi:hypothetical protein
MTTYFVLIDTLRRNTDLFKTKFGQFLASGFSASAGFWLIWPFETLKNQVQAGTKNIGEGWISRWKYMIKTHGITGPYRGILPGTISVFMRNGAAMIVMQKAHQLLTDNGFRKR